MVMKEFILIRKIARWLAIVLGMALTAACASVDPYTPARVTVNGEQIEGSIYSIETVVLGGVEQTITIRGVDATNPVLLHLHGGPGMPSAPWASWRDFYRALEEHFVVVHWDQRGAGKSYHQGMTADDVQIEDFVQDTLQLSDILRERFAQERIFLWGHSWGSGLGFEVLRVRTDPYYAFFASAVRPTWDESQRLGYKLVLGLARETGDTDAVEELTAIQPFDPSNADHLAMRGTYLSRYRVGDFRTEGLEEEWLSYAQRAQSPEYPRSTIGTVIAGMNFTNAAVKPEIARLGYDHARDFPVSDIPVHFLAGRYDFETPGVLAYEYFELLEAPAKSFTWFEDSAHDVFFDEPEQFGETLIGIASELLEKEL